MKSTASQILFLFSRRLAAIALSAGVFVTSLSARPVPANLGYGLDKLVESNIQLKQRGSKRGESGALYNGYATQEAANYAQRAITATDGRFLVDITLTGKVPFAQVRDYLTNNFSTFDITAVDETYRSVGVIEGFVSLDEAIGLAQAPGVRAVFLGLKPELNGARPEVLGPVGFKKEDPSRITPELNVTKLGSLFLQSVTQHRVDKINRFYTPSAPVDYTGAGVTVGVLSDSFDTRAPGGTNAAINMANFDLPGASTNPINTQPVVVLQDAPDESDEGRGMAEIVYKMAPKAKIGFATAFTGEVGFANNIRALSGKFPSVPNTIPTFQADVIVDDVGYGGEPVFSDGGIIMNGVDDVAAVGVSYFSSAANSFGVSVYNSDLRMVANGNGLTAAGNAALAGTNIDLTGVPTDLYQGGFHNFNPAGLDVACLWNVTTNTDGITAEMQWDDPYDNKDPVVNQPPIFVSSGTAQTTPVDFPGRPFTQGQNYVIFVTSQPSTPAFDAVVTIIRESDNRTIVNQDTGLNETVNFFPPTTGNYTIRVSRFDATSGGNFDITINTANGSSLITTDLNLLVFRADNGAYISSRSLTANNVASNRPVESGPVAAPTGQAGTAAGRVQFVIARSFTPTAPRAATRVRCGTASNSNSGNAPAEYFDYNSAVTDGHSIAAGGNGVAAYDVFRPNVPQNFTSGGPALIFFDRNQNLLLTPEVRLQPRFAAANNANSTWITGDSNNDNDTGGGQFGGTSAAAPAAAAIAALVLERHGGPGSVTPLQMRSVLQRSAFVHDLDPYQAVGVARSSNGGKVTVTIRSDNTATQSRGRNDPNSHSVAYVGPGSITSFVFNPNGLAGEGGAVTSGRNGVTDGGGASGTDAPYFSFLTPGMYFSTVTATGAFAFTQGASTGVPAGDVTFALSNPAPAPASQVLGAQGQTLTLSFANSSFTGGDVMRFTIGRGLIRGPNVTAAAGTSIANYNADLFGGGVPIPEGDVITDGMRFSGTISTGGVPATFSGVMRNRLGAGFSQLDGFGFLNAEAAVQTPLQ